MNLVDLKLLADTAYYEQTTGKMGFVVGSGFGLASKRLIERGILMQQPNCSNTIPPVVALTSDGEKLLDKLLEQK